MTGFLLPLIAAGLARGALRSEVPAREADRARLRVVREYADAVLKDAADRYREKPSPLLANGVDVYTGQQLRWIFPGGHEVVISDLAGQQNLLRVLVALSALTGEAGYKNAAKAQLAYYFAHFQDKGGLLQWGGHRFVDLRTLRAVGPNEKNGVHELKDVYPFYELMYEVDPQATSRFITGFWNAHVYDWRTLEISRHGAYGLEPGARWGSPFADPPPFQATIGLSFLDAGDDLIYAAAMLFRLSGDEGALLWSRRLAGQYVKARDPATGLGAYQYTRPRRRAETNDGDKTESWYGDRAERQLGADFPGHRVLEGTMLIRRLARTIYGKSALMQLELGRSLGPAGKELLAWTREGLLAFARRAYIPERNLLRPMLTDGTDLSGFVLKRNGYYGKAGRRLDPYPATTDLLLSYTRAALLTGDAELWEVARAMAKADDLGDLGRAPGRYARLNLATGSADALALFSLLEVYGRTRDAAYLDLARRLGDNLVAARYHHGYFTAFEDQINADVDAIEPLALLALEAAIRGTPGAVPTFLDGSGYIDGEYLFPDGKARGTRDVVLFRSRRSTGAAPLPMWRDPNDE